MIELLSRPIHLPPDPAPRILRPRLGFLGLGWIGRHRLQAVNGSDLADIIGLADPDRNAIKLSREFAPDAAVMNDLDSLLELDLDGVVIATPNAAHVAQTIAALNRGCAVFCQKPLARTSAETNRVIEVARSKDRLLQVDFSYRHARGMQEIRRLIRAGELGQIYGVEMVFHNCYGPDKPWFYDAQLSGGGCLLDLGTHLLDLALWCLDWPATDRVLARLFTGAQQLVGRSSSVEDYAAAHVQLGGGRIALNMGCSWKTPAGGGTRIEVCFYGTRGGARFQNVHGSFFDFTAEHFLPDQTCQQLAVPPDNWGGGAILEWIERLAKSPGFDPEIESLRRVADLIDALYETSA